MHRSATLIFTVLMGVSAALAGDRQYQTGKLLSVTDSRSNREIQNSYSGGTVTVTDVEYRLSVRVGEMVYVGSYWPRAWSYKPTDLIVNDPIDVRIEGKHMYIKRSGGKELKTDIVQRIRATS